ncbi:major facilitator superfamily, partial [Zychaea mexicana]|uniref:major facilitator superfamily n=1 Tax=Zychaea mexicana TaxID=64656 RepID=UPI0022FE9531
GGISNAFGRKPVLITLNMLFLIGSFWCGYANSFEQVVIARAISGLGGGGIVLIGNIILHDIVSREHLGLYLGYYNTAGMLGFGLGGPIGGFITDYFGWRYCFKINIIPMMIIIAIYTLYFQNYTGPQKNQKAGLTIKERLRIVDFGGILLLSIANISLACALFLGGNAYNWSSPQMIVILASMAVGYLLFFIHERRWAANPLISRAALRDRNFTTSCICSFSAAACEGAAVTVIPQFLMGVLYFDTSKAGLWVMANAAATPVGTILAGCYMQWSGRFKRFLLADMASYLLMVIVFYNWVSGIVPISVGTMGIVLEGVCYGGIQVCIIVACTSTLSKELAATALSIYTLARFMGYLAGTAVVSSIVHYTLKTVLPTKIDGENAEKVKIIRVMFPLEWTFGMIIE